MALSDFIIPLGIITLSLLIITALFGRRTKIIKAKLRLRIHKILAVTTITLALSHGGIVLYNQYMPLQISEIQVENQVNVQFVNNEGYNEISSENIVLQWKVENENIDVILTAPTNGWISIGFNPENMMQGANIIIGYIENENVFIQDDYGNYYTSHTKDDDLGGVQNIVSESGMEADMETILHFTIPLNSGDEYDTKLEKGSEYKILLACGNKDDFSTRHIKRTSVTIIL